MDIIKRFRVIDPSGQSETGKYDTITEVVADLRSPKRKADLFPYYVECLVDDIKIDADELLAAWDEGERPEDLQSF